MAFKQSLESDTSYIQEKFYNTARNVSTVAVYYNLKNTSMASCIEKPQHYTNSKILDPIVNMLVSFSHASPNQSTVCSTLQPVGFFVRQYVVIHTYT